MKILLAEDNVVNQKVAIGFLNRWGYEVQLAANGWEALEMWRKGGYDLILMDLQMPEMSGFECAQSIRREEKNLHTFIPIVALTAHAMRGDRERCLAAGMNEYISKPINPNQLKKVLESLLSKEKIEPSLNCKKGPEVADSLQKITMRLGGNQEMVREVIELFLAEYPQELKNLNFLFKQGDREGLIQLLRTLRGSLIYFGARDLAKHLEFLIRDLPNVSLEKLDPAFSQLKSDLKDLVGYLKSF